MLLANDSLAVSHPSYFHFHREFLREDASYLMNDFCNNDFCNVV